MKAAQCSLIIVTVVFTSIVFHKAMAKAPADTPAPAAETSYGSPSRPTSQPAKQLAASVRIENFSFLPRELDIAAGATVTWRNADDVPHTATSSDDPQVFDSGPLDTDDKFSFTFAKPGKYAYFCKVHPHMTGVVIVK